MLTIIRTPSRGLSQSTYLNATVRYVDDDSAEQTAEEVVFSMETYQKIAKEGPDGELILLHINIFFEILTNAEQKAIFEFYKFCKVTIDTMNAENKRVVQERLQRKAFDVVNKLKLADKMIAFCNTDRFQYPNLEEVGTAPHHTEEKTFLPEHYAELTAMTILSKMMIPIWGEFIGVLGDLDVSNLQREKIAYDLVVAVLQETSFGRIYNKLLRFLEWQVAEIRKSIDKRSMSNTSTSYILTHNFVDVQMFNAIIMASIVVKRMATYECFTRLKDGSIANAMVYIHDGIKRAADSRIKTMRNQIATMPRKELPGHETEDNQSIIDHVSRTSRRPIDVPLIIMWAVEHHEIPDLIKTLDIPMELFESACLYYRYNSFMIPPITEAMMASFVGERVGGSKCLDYLPITLYQQLVVILQVFLIRHGFLDLAALASSITSEEQIEGAESAIHARILSNYKSSPEYGYCLSTFRGHIDRPIVSYGKKANRNKPESERIDFVSHINRMTEWLTRRSHSENMAPVLWELANVDNRPVTGSECKFDENVVSNLCKYYLMFQSGTRPF